MIVYTYFYYFHKEVCFYDNFGIVVVNKYKNNIKVNLCFLEAYTYIIFIHKHRKNIYIINKFYIQYVLIYKN